ncbi:hypothetical protein [Terrabacter aerolatus]|uniref:hypothetical protein n=1 Tax=Terrabacter aerolatus TaxID=422442 RepID=UPI0011BE1964|nr:hypothetical protein [Terrabacter aerolatus]
MNDDSPSGGHGPGAVANGDQPAWDTTVGPGGIGYLIEALPSGVIGWQYDQALNSEYGLPVALAGAVWNLGGRIVFGFGWQLTVSRPGTRWPYRRKVVARRRLRSKVDAIKELPVVVEAVHGVGPKAFERRDDGLAAPRHAPITGHTADRVDALPAAVRDACQRLPSAPLQATSPSSAEANVLPKDESTHQHERDGNHDRCPPGSLAETEDRRRRAQCKKALKEHPTRLVARSDGTIAEVQHRNPCADSAKA